MKATKVFFAIVLGSMFVACQHEKFVEPTQEGNTDTPSKELLSESDYLDFSTTSAVSFDVNYGSLGQRVLVEIYDSMPQLRYSEEEGQTIVGQPIYKMFTDNEGHLKGDFILPSRLTTICLHTSALGVQQFANATIVNGQVKMDLSPKVPSGARKAPRFAEGSHRLWDLGTISNAHWYSIVGWQGNAYGKITDDNNGLLTYGSLSAEDLKIIKPYLGNNQTSEFNQHLVSSDIVNTTIAPEYVNEGGDTVVTESAQVYVTYVGEMGAWYQDGLGYYYYKTGEAPATRQEAQATLKHYVVLPNSSLAGDPPYIDNNIGQKNGYYNFGLDNAPAWANERIQLLFEDPETGQLTTHFPPGYTIGFFLYSKESNVNTNTDETYQLRLKQLWYSNEEWNTDNKKHFSALGYKDKILYGVEDGVNTSYNDLVFTVEADPTGVVKDKERYDIVPELPEEEATETTYKTYAFEDIWPTGGDYDLNDVIIEHSRTVTFDSYNYLKEVVDTFMAVQPSGAASYKDGFAIQIPANLRGNITLPAGAVDESETGSIILFNSAKDVRNRPYVIRRTFTGKQATKVGLDADDYNPFIMSQYNPSAATRTEIHLPKHKATSKTNTALIGADDDAYFINKDGIHPFSVMMPIRGFTAVTEKQPVEFDYPYFKAWVDSKMTGYQGWYLWHK